VLKNCTSISLGTDTSTCPSNVCYTLPGLVQSASELIHSNTDILFLPGHNNSLSTSVLYIHDVVNVSLVGIGHTKIRIFCHPEFYSGFVFANIANLTIANLEILECGTFTPYDFNRGALDYLSLSTSSRSTEWLIEYLLLNTTAAVWLGNVYNLTLSNISIRNSYYAGLVAINVFGSILFGSSFRFNCPNCIFVFWDSWPSAEKDYLYTFHTSEVSEGYMKDGFLATGLSMVFS